MVHTEASEVGAGATVTQTYKGFEQVIAYASHRRSRTGERRDATEHEYMSVL